MLNQADARMIVDTDGKNVSDKLKETAAQLAQNENQIGIL